MKIRMATIFSGIGAVEFALKRMNIDNELIFACDNGEREIKYNIEEERNKVFNLKTIDEKKKKNMLINYIYLKLLPKIMFNKAI